MEKAVFITLYLDTRRRLKSNKYPVKLRVFTPSPRKQKLYPTKFEFTEKDFNSVWNTIRPTNEAKVIRAELEALIKKAEAAAGGLTVFSFEAFEQLMYAPAGDRENVFYQYEKTIEQLNRNNQIGTASNYQYSMNSIRNFTGGKSDQLLFKEITPQWLQDYENYMQSIGKSMTTVSMYVRALRTLFNTAKSEGIITPEMYPFSTKQHDKKYIIPNATKVKKALNREQLKQLSEAIPATPEQAKAKDTFFFLYNMAGLNVKDMARLKYENLDEEKIIYLREKTKRTTKGKQKPIIVYLNRYSKNFIEKYGNPNRASQNLVFDIYTPGMTAAEQFRISHNFTRFLNQHLKELATANGLPGSISTYWSRHSFATNAVRNGATMEQVSQALNHKDIQTTQNYFAGFAPEVMKNLTDNLMDF